MSRTILGATRSSLLAFLLFSLSFGLAARVRARPPAQDAAKPAGEQEKSQTATPAAPGDYVGSETCKTCHEDMPSKGFYKAVHRENPRSSTRVPLKEILTRFLLILAFLSHPALAPAGKTDSASRAGRRLPHLSRPGVKSEEGRRTEHTSQIRLRDRTGNCREVSFLFARRKLINGRRARESFFLRG